MCFWSSTKNRLAFLLIACSLPVSLQAQETESIPRIHVRLCDAQLADDELPASSTRPPASLKFSLSDASLNNDAIPKPDAATADSQARILSVETESTQITPAEHQAERVSFEAVDPMFNSPQKETVEPNFEGSHVLIQPPMVQPYKNNQYTFVVENRGNVDAHDVSVELSVPKSARIIAIIPTDAVLTDQKAVVRFPKLRAGEHYNVHLTATSNEESKIEFSAKLTQASEQTFGADELKTVQTHHSPINQVHPTTSAGNYQTRPVPFIPDGNPVPIIQASSTEYQPRPNFQKNPHFKPNVSDQNARLANRTPIHSASTSGRPTNQFSPPAPNVHESQTRPHTFHQPVEVAKSAPTTQGPLGNTPSPKTKSSSPKMLSDQAAGKISLGISGPRDLRKNQTGEFTAKISNPRQEVLEEALVQLTLPTGFRVKSIDRDVWFDETTRTLSFRISLQPGSSASVHYKMEAIGDGFQIQKLSIEVDDKSKIETRFDTLVAKAESSASPQSTLLR